MGISIAFSNTSNDLVLSVKPYINCGICCETFSVKMLDINTVVKTVWYTCGGLLRLGEEWIVQKIGREYEKSVWKWCGANNLHGYP